MCGLIFYLKDSKMKTLSEQYPDLVQHFQNNGFQNLGYLLTIFYRGTDLDRALGYNGATNNWLNRKNMPHADAEKRATAHIEKISNSKPEPKQKEIDFQPAKQVSKYEKETMQILVIVPADKFEKLSKILNLFDCEYVDI